MLLSQKFYSFTSKFGFRSSTSPLDGSQRLKNGPQIKSVSTPTASGKPKIVEVDEEFRRSLSRGYYNTQICPQCEALHLDERIVEVLGSSEDFSVWPKFRLEKSIIDESCDLCQFYKSLYLRDDPSGNFRCFEIEQLDKRRCSILNSWELLITKEAKASGYSDVVITRGQSDPGLQPPDKWPVNPLGIDYEGLRNKLAFCAGRKIHSKGLPPPPHPIFVINCESRQIEQLPPGAKYVCLSYVWGPPQPTSPKYLGFGHLPNPTERTVEDTITVTSNLHYKYVWVDKYCIDQNSDDMKRDQIQQMGSIYAGADLTIVAAAGDHSDYGLPGVSTRPRLSRRSFRLGNHVLMPCWRPFNLALAVKQSRWMERGWTYQEALLSKRRLFFTEYCYLHDCEECYADGDETMQFDMWKRAPNSPHHKLIVSRSPWMEYNSFKVMADVAQRIKEYSRRHLTQQADALDAIAGVLQTYELASPPIHHYYGVPMLQPPSRLAEVCTSNMDGFVEALRWKLGQSASARRRPDFPSWSWVGWEGFCLMRSTAPLAPTQVGVEIELGSGERVDWARFGEMKYLRNDRSQRCIWLWAETFVVQTLDAPPLFQENFARQEILGYPPLDPARFQPCIRLFGKDNAEEVERLRERCEEGKLVAVVLGDTERELTTQSIIIVEECGDVYQRVGNFDDSDGSMLWSIAPSFWERDVVEVERRWIRLA